MVAAGSDEEETGLSAETAETEGRAKGGRLVVVSNRVPDPGKTQAGGLAVALDAALKERGGLWFGWSGRTVETGTASDAPRSRRRGPVTYATIDLDESEHEHYYAGFANRALWPVCHFRLDLIQISAKDTRGYFAVNERFARVLAPLLEPDDIVWVHDYHLIPLAAALRAAGVRNRIGFFLHIPWPPSQVSSALPAYQRLLSGLAAYDVVGFQTPLDAENFHACLARDLPEAAARPPLARDFPIGIETAAFVALAREAAQDELAVRLRRSMRGRDLIIGVDRLDYSKGIGQRLEAFERYLETHAESRDAVSLLQITPRSRSEVPEYQQMEQQVAEHVGRINGAFGDVDWVPIRYVNSPIPHTSLAGLYRMAKVGLVTPLRDGMNLVAKEFVAAQPEDDPGVLILSRFAGAVHELDGALIVNPYDTDATAAAIARALEMELDERTERWRRMMTRIAANTTREWAAEFIGVLEGRR